MFDSTVPLMSNSEKSFLHKIELVSKHPIIYERTKSLRMSQ